ncbi:hypothetical protein H0H87_004129 [Tephrocybe sp. NHM501043]|nr:hypothetical protein H0H87_004129 [Tephrocybe sp. NHM501043]
MSTQKSPLRDRLLSNSPDPIKSSIMRDSGMGWISPTSNPGSQSSGSSGSLTSPLRIAKRDSPRLLPQPPLARRSSSSFKHVRNNNLVSKSPFKSNPTHSPTPPRPISFPSPRKVSGEKRPRPSSMHDQAENENDRPFAIKRERRQSKTFQGLIQKEPVTKSPFKQPASSPEEQPMPPPLPLTHLLPTQAPPSHSSPSSLNPSASSVSSTGISPGRPSLVSRRMHGPRLSSGSRSRRERRKTVTWDEKCDVVEISADEHESESEGGEENSMEVDRSDEEPEEDPFFRGAQSTQVVDVPEDSSYESNDLSDASGGNGSSLMIGMGLDPDASISGLVEEIFASSSGTSPPTHQSPIIATSTPPRQADGSHLPPELEIEGGVPIGRSHHATRFLQHQREYSQSPKPAPPHFFSYSSAHSSPHQLNNGLAFNLPTQASPHGPPATPPRRSAAPSPSTQASCQLDSITEMMVSASTSRAASPAAVSPVFVTKVGTSHLDTPPLGRSTHAERSQLAREDVCDDVLMLPGTPSPTKNCRRPDDADSRHEDGLIPRFGMDVESSDISSTSLEDPFALPENLSIAHSENRSVDTANFTVVHKSEPPGLQATEDLEDASELTEVTSALNEDTSTLTQDTSVLTQDSQYLDNDSEFPDGQPSFTSEECANLDSNHLHSTNPPPNLDSPPSPHIPSGDIELLQRDTPRDTPEAPRPDDGNCSPVANIALLREDMEKDTLSLMTTMTDISTETAVIERAEKKTLTGANLMEGMEFGVNEAGRGFQFDFGSKFGRGLNIGDNDYGTGKLSLPTSGAGGDLTKENTPSIQSGSSMKMGDVDVDMDMRSALDRLMDDVAGAHADDSVMTEEDDSFDIPQSSRPHSSDPRFMERAVTDSRLLHNNGFVSRNASVSSASSIPPPPPPKDNIRSREQMILERRREARRIENEEFTPPKAGGGRQQLLRPSRRRSMSTGDADVPGGGARRRKDTILDVPGVGDTDARNKELGDSIEEELKKMVAAPPKKQTKYHIREREGTIYASSSDPDIVEHMVGPGDVNIGKAWRTVRRPSDMNEYSKQIKEYRAQEKSGKAYGKVFVKVLGVKGIHVPLPQQSTAITCTLNNGIHFVTTPECLLGKDFPIEQEFELIEHNKLEFTLTLKVRPDPHIVAQFKELAPAPQAPDPLPPVVQTSSKGSAKGGMRSFFSSSPKKSSKEKLPVQNLPMATQPAQRLPENLARYLKPDGTMARAFISFKDIASRCDTRLFETSYPLIGQHLEVGGKFSTLQVGEIVLQLFRLPALPGIAPEQLPQSLEECHRGLRHINWHKVTYFEGILTQSGGDCSTWRRRQLRVIGANLVAFNNITKKATATIDLKKAIAVEDNQEVRKSALSSGSSSRYDEDDGLYGVERSFRLNFPHGQEILFFADTDEEKAQWLDVLRALVGHIPPHPFWAELLWQHQEEQTRATQPPPRPPPQSSPAWLVSRGPQR